ncbi:MULTISPECIES: GMC family oxidoreductase [unclassified Beijerinckia]|uniref:GMC family oxidoreductase n=1 Tax=unclassified Beijerinckia TaxID=2638183 RepID=UPI00089C9818|nr:MULTISPECIES: GMC family oxidoreductase [unclassified Beijerinckia]MDH7799109.1 choline dehydrogenase-like flavoprotein [Beijerinckia sp. GAS462]SED94786.1 Choline dehydrogenase [Beijerinckia sp. 28-YEA-48]
MATATQNKTSAQTHDHVDAVVVGSGAAGALVAAKLAAQGKKVIILESGRSVLPPDMISSDIYARSLHWGGGMAELEVTQPVTIRTYFSTGSQTGGTAAHHYAAWFRLHEEDFHMKSTFGQGNDWPIAYSDLRTYYDRIQAEVGMAGDAEAEVWRPAGDPYPMPGLPAFQAAQVLKRGFDKLGLRTAPLPVAINTSEYKGRASCLYDGWCDAGCPIGALANPQTIYLHEAFQHGAKLVNDARVTRVLTTSNGKRATGVEYVDPKGALRTQYADLVVLAALSQTPRIMFNSTNGAHPNGLSNRNGMVGKYILVHPTLNVSGLFEDETEPHQGVSIGLMVSQDDYAKDPKKGYLASYQWLAAQAMKPNGLNGLAASRPDIYGAALDPWMKRAAKHYAAIQMVGEMIPRPENRIELSSDKDQFGLPLSRLTIAFSDNERALYNHASAVGKSILTAASATEVWASPLVNQHFMGGTIMGTDPDTSVTDSYGITHEVPNVMIAGNTLFPTSAGVNPTFTTHAIALRAVEHVLSNWPV